MSMKYLSLDTIDLTNHPYPQELNSLTITIRGTKNLFDIYFSAADIECAFDLNIPPQIDFTWINTPSGKDKYLSYPTIKRLLYPMQDLHPLAAPFLVWIDSLLFSSSKAKSFFRNSYETPQPSISSVAETLDNIDDEDCDDIYDADSLCSESSTTNTYLVSALQHKIDQLEHQLELKDKDISILEKDIQYKDKEIELLKLKLSIPSQACWI